MKANPGHAPAGRASWLLCALGVLACQEIQEYPADWASPVAMAAGDCSSLGGTYADVDSAGSIAGLLYLLTQSPGDGGPSTHADRVVISVPEPDTLSIVGYRDLAVVAQRRYSLRERSLDCRPDGAVVVPARGVLAGQGVIGYASVRLALSRDPQGYLVVKSEEKGFGSYGPIPMGGSSRTWSRFQPYVLEREGIRYAWFRFAYEPGRRPGPPHQGRPANGAPRDTWEREAVEHLAFDCAHGLWRIDARSVLYSDMVAITEPAANYPAPWQPLTPLSDESQAMQGICAQSAP